LHRRQPLKRGIPTCLASFETDVKPILLNDLRRTMLGIGARAEPCRHFGLRRVIREKLHIISQSVDEDEEMNLEYFLDLCRTSVLRRGTRVIIIDPWNELEHKSGRRERDEIHRPGAAGDQALRQGLRCRVLDHRASDQAVRGQGQDAEPARHFRLGELGEQG
jgi:hypothetical protein